MFAIGGLSAPAVHAATDTHKNGTSVAVTVTTSNTNKTIRVKDDLEDSRWMQAQYLRGSTGNTVYYLSNKEWSRNSCFGEHDYCDFFDQGVFLRYSSREDALF